MASGQKHILYIFVIHTEDMLHNIIAIFILSKSEESNILISDCIENFRTVKVGVSNQYGIDQITTMRIKTQIEDYICNIFKYVILKIRIEIEEKMHNLLFGYTKK